MRDDRTIEVRRVARQKVLGRDVPEVPLNHRRCRTRTRPSGTVRRCLQVLDSRLLRDRRHGGNQPRSRSGAPRRAPRRRVPRRSLAALGTQSRLGAAGPVDNPHRGVSPRIVALWPMSCPSGARRGCPEPRGAARATGSRAALLRPRCRRPSGQRAVDSLVEQAGDTLLALADTAQAARDARVASAPTRTRPPTRAPKPSAAAADPSDAAAADLPGRPRTTAWGVLGGRPLRVLRDDAAPWEPQ